MSEQNQNGKKRQNLSSAAFAYNRLSTYGTAYFFVIKKASARRIASIENPNMEKSLRYLPFSARFDLA